MPDPPARKPRRDDQLEVEVEAYDPRGGLLGRSGEYRVLLRRGVPGERLRVRVRRRRRSTIEADALEVLRPSPRAVDPPCVHFGTCGGCSHQDLAYSAQLEELGRVARELLLPLGERAPRVLPVIGCPDRWRYRNKMDFTFSNRRWVLSDEPEGVDADFALGLHVAGRYEKVLDIAGCEIQFAEGDAILASLRELAVERGLEPWDLREHRGLLRHAVLRKGVATGEILLYLVTSEEAPELVRPYADALLARHPEITTLVQGIRAGGATVAVGEREIVLHGPGAIRERLGGLTFTVSPTSFFQTNTVQAERLLEEVASRARVPVDGGGGVLYDLYCGAGTLSLPLASRVREVVGFELVEAAVEDARRNAAANGVDNARFVAGDLAKTLRPDALPSDPPDVVLVDPPRAGMHPRTLSALRALAPPRIVYVSCNLRSAARDLEPLLADGYRAGSLRPIDLFPHTPHLESVVALERGSSEGERESETGAEAEGQCPRCAHVKVVRSGKGSTFWLCTAAANDPRLRRYPPQPVLSCPAFEG